MTSGLQLGQQFCLFSRPLSQDLLFCPKKSHPREFTDELCDLLRDFVLARRGTLAHLSIPPVQNMNVLNPLRDHITRFEVRFTLVLFLIILLRCQNSVTAPYFSFDI
jgi:hypothetical protein